MDFLFTSESVTEGHPDKLADQISDAVLDSVLAQDKEGRVACETLVGKGFVFVTGEITTTCYVDMPGVVRETIKLAGYTNPAYGFDFECGVMTAINEQSPDIAIGVDRMGAGDQGLMFGYAIAETEELMPLPIMLAHKLVKKLAYVRKSDILSFLRPDGKSQVTILYKDNKPKEVTSVVISAQHDEDINYETLEEGIIEEVIKRVIPEDLLAKDVKYYINPTGRFIIGGPQADTGLTGRKIMVDTYGGFSRHGGGCFSGKDPTKVDRSASYMARYLAKNIVSSGIAYKCEIQLAYVIGMSEPVSIMIDTFNTSTVDEETILKVIKKNFDLTPAGIINYLDLRRPIYKNTAVYGHFGRKETENFTWEKCDKGDLFKDIK